MRKKIKMRSGGKVAKYAEGGTVRGQRPTEDRARMAADAAAGFDAEEARIMERRRAANPWLRGESLINNRPVGAAPRTASSTPMPAGEDVDGTGTGAAARPVSRPLPTPPVPPRAQRTASGSGAARSRGRGMSADDLNEREMTRILNDRSLEAARAGRNMYRKGGLVKAKKGSK